MKKILILLCIVAFATSFPQRHRKKPNRQNPGNAGGFGSGSAANAGCNIKIKLDKIEILKCINM
jgi:hypothetical protein